MNKLTYYQSEDYNNYDDESVCQLIEINSMDIGDVSKLNFD